MHLGADVAPADSDLGEGGEHVEARDPPGGALETPDLGRDRAPELAEEPRLELEDRLLGPGDLLLPLFQFGGEVPLGVGERLLPDIVVGDAVQVRPRHLEVVSEDPVEPHLERADPGPLPLARLERGDEPPRPVAHLPELVELLAHPGPDHAAVLEGGARFFREAPADPPRDVFEKVPPHGRPAERLGGSRATQRLETGEDLEGAAER